MPNSIKRLRRNTIVALVVAEVLGAVMIVSSFSSNVGFAVFVLVIAVLLLALTPIALRSLPLIPQFGEEITPEVVERIAVLTPVQKAEEIETVMSRAMYHHLGTLDELVTFRDQVRMFYNNPEAHLHHKVRFPSIQVARVLTKPKT